MGGSTVFIIYHYAVSTVLATGTQNFVLRVLATILGGWNKLLLSIGQLVRLVGLSEYR